VYNIEPASIRRLRLQDPRIVKRYTQTLHELIANQNVLPRLEKLQETFNNQQWSTDSIAEYESLDIIISESMLSAERSLSKRITTTYQWSPLIKKAVQRLRYWHLRLWQVRNLPVSTNQLEHFQRDGELSEEAQALSEEVDIKKAQSAACKNLKELQTKHQELRETYLEDMAKAIILDRSPTLAEPGLEPITKDRAEKQLKQLLSREKAREMYWKIGRVLNKATGKGLSRIDIPDAAAVTETSGDPNQPKTWKGPWKSVTNPHEIAREVCKINANQYHQAHHTPLGSGPVATLLGRRGNTPASGELLRGNLPDNLDPR
jgi:hypothetical protein